MDKINILGMRVDVSSFDDALFKIKSWSRSKNTGRYVCLSNVHMCMEVYDSHTYKTVVNNADLVLADGRPIYWAQRLLGTRDATQIRGTDLALKVCRQAALDGTPIGLYGGTTQQLIRLNLHLKQLFPALKIACQIAPPFRPLTIEEDRSVVAQINNSGARILLVGLGCPKQEKWMADHKSKIDCVMLGVGAAFDFITGAKQSAPSLLCLLGLEWIFRLACEPRRLWLRYLKHNPRYVLFFLKQWVFDKVFLVKSRERKTIKIKPMAEKNKNIFD